MMLNKVSMHECVVFLVNAVEVDGRNSGGRRTICPVRLKGSDPINTYERLNKPTVSAEACPLSVQLKAPSAR